MVAPDSNPKANATDRNIGKNVNFSRKAAGLGHLGPLHCAAVREICVSGNVGQAATAFIAGGVAPWATCSLRPARTIATSRARIPLSQILPEHDQYRALAQPTPTPPGGSSGHSENGSQTTLGGSAPVPPTPFLFICRLLTTDRARRSEQSCGSIPGSVSVSLSVVLPNRRSLILLKN